MKQNGLRFSCLVFITCIALIVGCTAAITPTPTLTPTATPVTSPSQTPITPPTSLPNGTLVNLPSFADLVDAVKQSVVAISTTFVGGSGAGSGWIIDRSGTIVTNHHVIEGARSITVQLYDGTVYTPVSVSGDQMADIAVLKVNTGRQLPALAIGDTSTLRVGDWVVIVGNALGLGISMKQGTISRLGVAIACPTGEACNNLIETDAPINPGNSGGPMFNLSGEVIGITSLKFSAAGVEGLGYAISIANALPVIQSLSR